MSDDLLKRAEDWKLAPPDAKTEDAWFVIRDLAARVRELEAERSAMIDNVRFARERAERAEAERNTLRALLREARLYIGVWSDDPLAPLIERIDAALKEKP